MSTDDVLRERLRAAADAAGAHANPSDAMRVVDAGPPPPTGPKLWLLGVITVVALAAGTLAGATVLSPGADADDGTAASTGGVDAASEASTNPAAPMVGAAFDCPGGAEVGRLRAGDRVYVVGRDESGAWAAIRDPRDIADVVWVERAALVPDADLDVDVVECDEPTPLLPPAATETTTTTTVPGAPSTTVASPPKPGTPTTTAPGTQPGTGATVTTTTSAPTTTAAAPDTQAPTLQLSADHSEIFRDDPYCARQAVLTAIAADDVGVTAVTGTYSGLPGSPLTFTRTGGSPANGTWTATFGPFTSPTTQDVIITVTARDAAGNSRNAVVTIKYWGVCLS